MSKEDNSEMRFDDLLDYEPAIQLNINKSPEVIAQKQMKAFKKLYLLAEKDAKAASSKLLKYFKNNYDINCQNADANNKGFIHLLIIRRLKALLDEVFGFPNIKIDLELKDFNGETPLHYIAKKKDRGFTTNIAKLLVAKGADINAINAKNETPLFLALKAGNTKAAKFFLRYDVRLEKDLLKLPGAINNDEIATLLREKLYIPDVSLSTGINYDIRMLFPSITDTLSYIYVHDEHLSSCFTAASNNQLEWKNYSGSSKKQKLNPPNSKLLSGVGNFIIQDEIVTKKDNGFQGDSGAGPEELLDSILLGNELFPFDDIEYTTH